MEKGKEIRCCQKLVGREGWIRQSTEDIHGSENSLYGTMLMDASHYAFIQTARISTLM